MTRLKLFRLIFLLFLALSTMSQKEISPSSYTYYDSAGTCRTTHNISGDITLFNLNAQVKKFIVLEFNDVKFERQVLIKDAFLFYTPKEPGDEGINQVLYVAPIPSELYGRSPDRRSLPSLFSRPLGI